ncbi:MAG: hypothetical protein MRERV_14c046 [Mycoplasmataceae bacterium RV_VA103A]|nr:MAG: hypothetical protein MRERV_14c046 [Mycoplasmataceae bacterium RV_VA103A]
MFYFNALFFNLLFRLHDFNFVAKNKGFYLKE